MNLRSAHAYLTAARPPMPPPVSQCAPPPPVHSAATKVEAGQSRGGDLFVYIYIYIYKYIYIYIYIHAPLLYLNAPPLWYTAPRLKWRPVAPGERSFSAVLRLVRLCLLGVALRWAWRVRVHPSVSKYAPPPPVYSAATRVEAGRARGEELFSGASLGAALLAGRGTALGLEGAAALATAPFEALKKEYEALQTERQEVLEKVQYIYIYMYIYIYI